MNSFQVEEFFKMVEKMVNTHKGDIFTAYAVVDTIEVKHPGFDKPFDQLVPMLIMDFK